MKLRKNSILAKLYLFFYTTNVLPQSLCIYFWKLVIMWILILPLLIISLPGLIIDLITRDKTCFFEPDSNGIRVLSGVMIYFFLLVVYFLSIHIQYVLGSDFNIELIYGCLFIWLIIIAALIGKGIHILHKRIKTCKGQHNKVKSSSIIKEFVKAKYNKYCPKIDWEE